MPEQERAGRQPKINTFIVKSRFLGYLYKKVFSYLSVLAKLNIASEFYFPAVIYQRSHSTSNMKIYQYFIVTDFEISSDLLTKSSAGLASHLGTPMHQIKCL